MNKFRPTKINIFERLKLQTPLTKEGLKLVGTKTF
jgi:hypothetical protein